MDQQRYLKAFDFHLKSVKIVKKKITTRKPNSSKFEHQTAKH